MRLFRRRSAAGGTPYRSDNDWTVSCSWSRKCSVSSEAAFSSSSELVLLLSTGGGVVGASAIYGGGGAEAGMDLYPKFGTEEYDGGSLGLAVTATAYLTLGRRGSTMQSAGCPKGRAHINNYENTKRSYYFE